MERYVIYKRVSTADQGRSGLGLEAQARDLALYLETYSPEPFEVIAEYVDVQSGKDDDRPELTKAIDHAKRDKAVLLVAKLDRLSRKVSFISQLMEDKRLDFRVASMPSADKFQLHIYAALAEQERDFISQRTKAALKQAKLRGQKLGGIRDKTMKRNEALKAQADIRAHKLEGIVKPLREQGATLRDIAASLNAAGISTPRGGDWQAVQVKRLLERLQKK
ncbi:recombinase family protein [Thalassospira sp. MIT1370]|uniref:recombinase family protein n=1 Tax=unclassified Thalassospira TaxID=2648997 RepID=UPI00399BB2B7